MMRDTEPEKIVNHEEVQAVVSDLKLELAGRDVLFSVCFPEVLNLIGYC